MRNRDREHASDPKLFTLTSQDVAAVRTGAWLGTKVTSAELRGHHDTDPDGVAELAARCEVMAE